jgi:hypothetical protein
LLVRADNLLVTAPQGTSVLSVDYFATTNQVLEDLSALPGAVVATGLTQFTYDYVRECAVVNSCAHPGNYCRVACELLAETFNLEANVSYAILRLPADLFETPGIDWLHSARDLLAAAAVQYPGYQFALANGAAIVIDATDVVYQDFPKAVGITASLVVLLVGVAFRSFTIPLRSVASIATTLAFVYGAGVFVYQVGIFDFMNFSGLKGQGALCWLVPVFSFSVLVRCCFLLLWWLSGGQQQQCPVGWPVA